MFDKTPYPRPRKFARTFARRLAFGPSRVHRSHHAQGSILILAVVVLVMIALLGLAFVQQAKFDRYATSRYEREFIPLVIGGVIDDMRTKLTDDVNDNLDAPEGLYDYPWTDHGQTRWKVTDGEGNPQMADGAPEVKVNPDDHPRDDKYLASTAPLVTGNTSTSVTWPHLSNLGGFWLDLPALGSGNTDPAEHLIVDPSGDADGSDTMVTGTYLSNKNAADYDPRGFDADGDGVLDSRWTWVPPSVRDFGGRRYVMAVRLIDLDALINANVATANTTNGTPAAFSPTATNLPNGYTPTDIDLSRLLARVYDTQNGTTGELMATRSGNWTDELSNLLGYRFKIGGFDAPPPSDMQGGAQGWPYTFIQRTNIWENQARLYGFGEGRYGAADELELRYQGGLNNSDYTADIEDGASTPPANGMPRLTRNQPTPDPAEGSALGVASAAGGNLHDWFHGGQPSDNIQNRQFPDVRHMLTTVSGTAPYQPSYGQTGGTTNPGRFRYDLNHHADSTDIDKQYTRISDRLTQAMNVSGTKRYLQDSTSSAVLTDEVIPEYALNIIDYADEDYIPTEKAGRLGFERLPFLREAYFQVLYEERDNTDSDGDKNADTVGGNPFDKWFALDGDSTPPSGWSATHADYDSRSFAVEIGNPFAHKMEASKLEDNVRLAIKMGDPDRSPVATWQYKSGFNDIDARDDTQTTDAKDTLILWMKPADTNLNDSGKSGATLPTDMGFGGAPTATLGDPDGGAGPDKPFVCNNATIIVEMQVKLDDGSWVTYDRMDTRQSFPESKDTSSGGDTNQDVSMAQRDASRYSKNIQYVASVGTGGTLGSGSAAPTDPKDGGGSFDQNASNLSKDNKEGSPTNPFATFDPDDGLQLPHPDRHDPANNNSPAAFHSLAELGWMCMVGFSRNQTLSDRLGQLADAQPHRLFLDLRTDRSVSGFPTNYPIAEAPVSDPSAGGGGGSGLPFAAMVLDQFSVNSPQDDNIDEGNIDGDNAASTVTSANDAEELKIPGTININTATLPVLTLAAPLPERLLDTEALMRSIVAYRDQPIVKNDPNAPDGGFNAADARDPASSSPKGVVTNRKDFPGIASMGELLFLNPMGTPAPGDTSADDNHNMQQKGYDANSQNQSVYDFYPAPQDQDTSYNFDTTGDAEEKLARWQFLSQAFSTRSDVYAAYVTIRGYRDGNFNGGPVEAASFVVIFDRSNLKDDDSAAKVIAYRRYK